MLLQRGDETDERRTPRRCERVRKEVENKGALEIRERLHSAQEKKKKPCVNKP